MQNLALVYHHVGARVLCSLIQDETTIAHAVVVMAPLHMLSDILVRNLKSEEALAAVIATSGTFLLVRSCRFICMLPMCIIANRR